MGYYKAAAWAKEQGGTLPTRRHADYLATTIGKEGNRDILSTLFNNTHYRALLEMWLSEPVIRDKYIKEGYPQYMGMTNGKYGDGSPAGSPYTAVSVRR